MQHLTLEELARLVDEKARPDEARHLETCARCASDLACLKRQTTELAELPDPEHSPIWEKIGQSLRDEGLVATPLVAGRFDTPVLRAAAGIALFIVGAAAGGLGTSLLRDDAVSGPYSPPADLTQATAALRSAETAYLRAVIDYAEHTEAGEGLDPLNRLAALEGIVLTTREALRDAPADPVINNYHLTALGQREALLRQLQQAEASAGGAEWF